MKTLTAIEAAARQLWVGWGAYAQFTVCDECEEFLYCRSRSGGTHARYLCLDCFDQVVPVR